MCAVFKIVGQRFIVCWEQGFLEVRGKAHNKFSSFIFLEGMKKTQDGFKINKILKDANGNFF